MLYGSSGPDAHLERHRPLQDVAEDVLLDVLIEQVGHLDQLPSAVPFIHFAPTLPFTIV